MPAGHNSLDLSAKDRYWPWGSIYLILRRKKQEKGGQTIQCASHLQVLSKWLFQHLLFLLAYSISLLPTIALIVPTIDRSYILKDPRKVPVPTSTIDRREGEIVGLITQGFFGRVRSDLRWRGVNVRGSLPGPRILSGKGPPRGHPLTRVPDTGID